MFRIQNSAELLGQGLCSPYSPNARSFLQVTTQDFKLPEIATVQESFWQSPEPAQFASGGNVITGSRVQSGLSRLEGGKSDPTMLEGFHGS